MLIFWLKCRQRAITSETLREVLRPTAGHRMTVMRLCHPRFVTPGLKNDPRVRRGGRGHHNPETTSAASCASLCITELHSGKPTRTPFPVARYFHRLHFECSRLFPYC